MKSNTAMHVKETEFNSGNFFFKTPTSRQKSYPINTVIPETNETSEVTRPSFFRSKSSIAKFSFASKISDGFTFSAKKETNGENESTDGKRSLFDFTPLKNKNIQRSDDSSNIDEVSSINSFNHYFKSMTFRRKKSAQKDGNFPGSLTSLKTASNVSEQLSPFLEVDLNQLATVNCDSLPMQVGTLESQTRSDAMHPLFQLEIFKSVINDAINDAVLEYKFAVNDAIVNFQIEMIRQMELQKEQIRQMIHQSANKDLVCEVNRLRTENEMLRSKHLQ